MWRQTDKHARRFRRLQFFPSTLSAPNFDDAFSDGLTDEVAATVSHLDGVRVAGRRSANVFKGKHDDLREIGSRLNVEAVVEGSVQRAADRTHVTVELNRTRDGFTIWSQTYDRTTNDWMQIESQIAGSIARALARKLSSENAPPAIPKPTLFTWRRATFGTSETFHPNSRVWICCARSQTMGWLGLLWRTLRLRSATLKKWIRLLNVDPEYDPIRSDPRFQAIVKRLGVG